MKQPIYISGKISGLDIDEVYQKFQKTEDKLRNMGYTEIINPMKNISMETIKMTRTTKQDYEFWCRCMIQDIESLFKCNAIYMQKGWTSSVGAKIELFIADSIRLKNTKCGFDITYE